METQHINVQQHRETCDGVLLRWLFAAGLAWLERHAQRVNELNVFPVPDGDTGTNMVLTMRKAYESVAAMTDTNASMVALAAARGALMGARGNSGVILSQILNGFARGLNGSEAFSARQFAEACQHAVDAAYKAVIKPVEGTILTVTRESVAALQPLADQPNATLRATLEALVDHGRQSLANTPNLLPMLKKAGVVDSGGAGLVYILEGMLRFLQGEHITETNEVAQVSADAQSWQDALVPDDEEGYGYDVQFLIHGRALDVARVRADIDAMGWSTLVVGDDRLIKVHVHVHNPAEPLNYAIAMLGAEIDDVVVENMQRQYETYVEDRSARETVHFKEVEGVAVITVVSGDGLTRLFLDDLQASYVIHGGQTMNPSTEDFMNAIDAVPNSSVILLPNNKNIIMAATQAADMARHKSVRVIPSRTVMQGISAMMAYTPEADVDALAETMRDALHDAMTGEITTATRTVDLDGVEVREGQYIGLLDGKLVVADDDMLSTIARLLDHCCATQRELVTLYYGDQQTEQDAHALAARLQADFDGLTFEVVHGGQALYPYLFSVE